MVLAVPDRPAPRPPPPPDGAVFVLKSPGQPAQAAPTVVVVSRSDAWRVARGVGGSRVGAARAGKMPAPGGANRSQRTACRLEPQVTRPDGPPRKVLAPIPQAAPSPLGTGFHEPQ